MKKLLFLLVVVAGCYFGLKKWSPGTLEKLSTLIRKDAPSVVATDSQQALPPPEPAPLPVAEPVPTPPPAPAASATAKADTTEQPSAPAVAPKVAVDKSAQVVVLCYHRVEGQAGGPLSIAPGLFEQHMQRLRDNGISVISMQDFLAWRRNEKSIPPKSAIISLDDGYVSAVEVARPILKKFGYPWTYFIYTKYVGSGGKSVTWEQLAELRDEGVEIGCHTATHTSLRDTRGKSPETYEQWLHDEIIGSKELIENKLGIKCSVFAYPEGRYNTKVLDVVKEAGFDAAFTVYGQRVTHGAHADRIGRYAWYSRRPQDLEMAFNFSGPLSASEADSPVAAELAASMMITQPMHGDSTADPEPVLKANLSSLGAIEEGSIAMRLSGVGPIPFKYDPESRIIQARPPQPLKPGEHTVVVSAKSGGKRVETQWTFKFDPAAKLNANANPPAVEKPN
jgi:peptidoglycan/xylan/chitin deacetylase (PgdA/CDA1 family)